MLMDEYQYYLKDHLGNVRVTFAGDGTVVQGKHYYPFGLEMAGRGYESGGYVNKYRYNGKELEDDLLSANRSVSVYPDVLCIGIIKR